jgi:hypothetical protein
VTISDIDQRLIERYLDDELSDDERGLFLDRLKTDDALQSQLDLAERLTASLVRTFAMPESAEPESVNSRIASAQEQSRETSTLRLPRRVGLTLAAAAAVLAIGVAIKLNLPPPAPVFNTLLERTYSTFESTDFTPEWVCETDEEFAAAVRDRLGQPMLVGADAAGIELLGWAYTEETSGYGDTIISDDSMILLTRVEGQGVMVIVDRVEDEREPMTIGDHLGLSLFRRVLGDLVLYEVTPRDEPSVVGLAYTPTG